MTQNKPSLLTQLEEAPTLWAAADIAEQLGKNDTSPVYPVIERLLRRLALDTFSKPSRFQKTPRIHSNQQIFEAALAENWEGITEQGLLEAVIAAVWPNPTATFAAARLAKMDPAYAVLPRIVTPWVTRRDDADASAEGETA